MKRGRLVSLNLSTAIERSHVTLLSELRQTNNVVIYARVYVSRQRGIQVSGVCITAERDPGVWSSVLFALGPQAHMYTLFILSKLSCVALPKSDQTRTEKLMLSCIRPTATLLPNTSTTYQFVAPIVQK